MMTALSRHGNILQVKIIGLIRYQNQEHAGDLQLASYHSVHRKICIQIKKLNYAIPLLLT